MVIPFSQREDEKPQRHTQRYPLSVYPDWQIPPFLQGLDSQGV